MEINRFRVGCRGVILAGGPDGPEMLYIPPKLSSLSAVRVRDGKSGKGGEKREQRVEPRRMR